MYDGKSGGEDKKNSGEIGEIYVSNFLNLIGWKNFKSGVDIPCLMSEKHKKPNETHGVDRIYQYKSTLDKGRMIHAVMSVKHSTNDYVSSKFKEYFSDLANVVDCYESSLSNNECIDDVEIYKSPQVIGVLFWISSKEERTKSAITNLNLSLRLPSELNYDRIQIMDNDRMEFITNSIDAVKKRFSKHKIEFYYISTPYNMSDRPYSGSKLPIEMFNSDIQTFRLQKDDEIILAIVVKDEFNPDNLKRIFGLSHKISNNFTNNVVILFPSFEHKVQKNINIVNSIKDLFQDKDFIDTTNVYGYDIGFKDVLELVEISDEVSDEEILEPLSDNGKILPYGEYLRSYINHSSITESELNIFLKSKGIYVCKYAKKEFTIPVISSMLVSPTEFEILKNHHTLTESKDKRRSSSLETTSNISGEDLAKVLNVINLNEIAKSKFPNYKFTIPESEFKLDKEKKQITLEYEIESYYRNRSWDEQINIFKGKVVFDYSKKRLEIISNNIYTSTETFEIGRKIINYAKAKLKEANLIKSTKENQILMDNLSNEQILQFLLSFTDDSSLNEIEFKTIKSIDIELSNKDEIPSDSDLKWVENSIQKLKLDGANLQELKIIKENGNHKYLKCWGIIVEYKFNTFKAKGSVIVRLEFYKANKNNEFMVIIDKYDYDKRLFTKKTIDDMVLSEIDNIKHSKYQEIMEKTNV